MSAVLLLVGSVFLASAVEAVEALTIVLAVGTTRGWRSTMQGVAAGLVVLAVIVAVLGPALSVVPLQALRLVVGALLLILGLQWLSKAVLRASGWKAVHDEDAIFEAQLRQAQSTAAQRRWVVADGYSFALAFKAVVLEGLEVAFIVVTVGASQGSLGLAALGAGLALVAVVITGVAVRAPLARVPENTMKFVVGVMLTGFGVFWGAEGAGAQWPLADVALLGVLAFVLVTAIVAVLVMRWARGRVRRSETDWVVTQS
ncbi:MAG: hypothetical protein JWR88_1792 [Pseudonocardia sp.]|jgi:uncharacterized membrane protein|nr:hypothetical protein [Pseudonocardia sp.]